MPFGYRWKHLPMRKVPIDIIEQYVQNLPNNSGMNYEAN